MYWLWVVGEEVAVVIILLMDLLVAVAVADM
jgi:hypothetical protein